MITLNSCGVLDLKFISMNINIKVVRCRVSTPLYIRGYYRLETLMYTGFLWKNFALLTPFYTKNLPKYGFNIGVIWSNI